MALEIRVITPDDLASWSRMRTMLWPDTPDAHVSEIKEFFSGTSMDVEEVYLAEVNSEVVGLIELNIRNFAEGSRHPKVPYVEAWFVESGHRGKGVGRRLMNRAEGWAREQGYDELASDTEVENHHSIATHKHLGFTETERVVCFLKKL